MRCQALFEDLALTPLTAVGVCERSSRLELHRNRVTGALGSPVTPALDDDGILEVLVKVIHVLDHAVLDRPGDGDVVEEREMLDVLAQADAPGMRAHRDALLRRHEHDGQVLVDASETTAVDLAESDGIRLEKLFEDHAVVTVLPGRDADRELPLLRLPEPGLRTVQGQEGAPGRPGLPDG